MFRPLFIFTKKHPSPVVNPAIHPLPRLAEQRRGWGSNRLSLILYSNLSKDLTSLNFNFKFSDIPLLSADFILIILFNPSPPYFVRRPRAAAGFFLYIKKKTKKKAAKRGLNVLF